MKKWYENRYLLAAVVAVVFGVFGGLQQLNLLLAKTHPEYANILGAVLIGIALFIQVLPQPKDIVNPTVRIVTNAPAPATREEKEFVSSAEITTVTVAPPSPVQSPPVEPPPPIPRTASGRFNRTASQVVAHEDAPSPP